jgi:lipid-A-disaccharide synthase
MAPGITIVTGEASGDVYGSMLASEIMRKSPGIEVTGVGGGRMREAGVDIVLDSSNLSVVGVWEAIVRLPELRRAMNTVKDYIAGRKPDLLILIDYPGMNLRLARFAKGKGVRVMYYVSPQVWAWGRNRISSIRKYVDKMVVILPFELELYRDEGVPVEYVGHPLIDIVKTAMSKEAFLEKNGLNRAYKLVSLLPGSRLQEIDRHLPPLVDTAMELAGSLEHLQFIVISLPEHSGLITDYLRKHDVDFKVVTDNKYEAIAASDLALTCSGTVTLEAALLGTPMIVIYRLSFLSWLLGKLVVRVPYISLVNLVAGRRVVPELIQGRVTSRELVRESRRILEDGEVSRRMREGLADVRSKLGEGGATARAADVAISLAA